MADGSWYDADIDHVIITEAQIREKITELAKQVSVDYAAEQDGLLLVCVLKGAVMFMADFARALGRHGPPAELEFMAVSSYGQGTTSSGVVRILKDLDRDIAESRGCFRSHQHARGGPGEARAARVACMP